MDVGARKEWLDLYLKSHPADYMFWLLEVPILTKWLTKFGIPIVPGWHSRARKGLEEWALQAVDKTEKALIGFPATQMAAGNFPIIFHQLKSALADEEEQAEKKAERNLLSQDQRSEVAGECLDHLGLSH